jgi:peptidoglycan L-alanyl-D-glutamate endopeptidase CwlK
VVEGAEVTERDEINLRGCHPALIAKVRILLDYMATIKPMKTAGRALRTTAEQKMLWLQGRPQFGGRPGKIVTYADGVKNKSNHQPKADGYAYAVDLCFVDDPRTPKDETWDEATWTQYGPLMYAKARSLGLKCGADWTKPDRPHVELPPQLGGETQAA